MYTSSKIYWVAKNTSTIREEEFFFEVEEFAYLLPTVSSLLKAYIKSIASVGDDEIKRLDPKQNKASTSWTFANLEHNFKKPINVIAIFSSLSPSLFLY